MVVDSFLPASSYNAAVSTSVELLHISANSFEEATTAHCSIVDPVGRQAHTAGSSTCCLRRTAYMVTRELGNAAR